MEGIPPARASDNEDVIWALETAESLWKRNARADAIVWLRRAAEEAAEAGDDDRASALMVEAAALTETLSRKSSHPHVAAVTVPPPGDEEPAVSQTGLSDVDSLLSTAGEAVTKQHPIVPPGDAPEELLDLDDADVISMPASVSVRTPIPTGEPSHEDVDALLEDAPSSDVVTPIFAEDAVLAHLMVPAAPAEAEPPSTGVVESAELETEVEGITRMGADALSPLDLAGIALLSKTSDAQRRELVRTAKVILCTAGVALPEFAFAVILDGEVSATLDPGDAIIARVGQGAGLRRRGATGRADGTEFTALRFTATADDTTLALWTEAALSAALRDDPAIDRDLRADGDRLLAWAAVAQSPMASRLYEDVRLRLVERLQARTLGPGAELVAKGQPVPGLLLVGSGTIVLEGSPPRISGPGEFVFPQATLSAGRATTTARAGDRGAIVLAADRHTTQELWATEPLLLELLATAS